MITESKVTVVADELNNVIRQSSNPEYGWILLSQSVPVFKGRFMNISTRTAILNGKLSDLVEINLKAGQELDGKIYIHESLEQTNPNNAQQDLKIAGDSGIACTIDDQPIYRQAFYTTNLKMEDHLLEHDNSAEIRGLAKSKAIQNADKVSL